MKRLITFVKDRETKRTIRYKEIPALPMEQAIVGTLYVRKWFAQEFDKMVVEIEGVKANVKS